MPKWFAAALVTFAVYLPTALWLRASFVDPRPRGGVVVQLLPPFAAEGGASYRAAPGRNILPGDALALKGLADIPTVEGDARSPVVVYEDDRPLGPAHSNFADIGKLGMGRFAYWENRIIFSSSDDSNPNNNGRHYWAVVP